MTLWEVLQEAKRNRDVVFVDKDGCTIYFDGTYFNLDIEDDSFLLDLWGWQKQTPRVDWNTAVEHMRKDFNNHAELDEVFRITKDGYLQLWVDGDMDDGDSWEPANLRTEMLDSKNWKLC